jgi:hypothetical protein
VPDVVCAECGVIHDKTRCNDHVQATGMQCTARPAHGGDKCAGHVRAELSAQVKIASPEERPAVAQALAATGGGRKVRIVNGILQGRPIFNPLQELQDLAGEARAWKEAMGERIDLLLAEERIRYNAGAGGGEQIRGEVVLWERAVDRLAGILQMVARLKIDERLVAIEESKRDMVVAAFEAGLAKVGITGPELLTAKAEMARKLRVITIDPQYEQQQQRQPPAIAA